MSIDKSSENPNKTEKKRSIGKAILDCIEVFAIVIAVAFVINRFLISTTIVKTSGMQPSIMSESRVFASRLSYLNSDPKRGDVVIFHWPDNEKIYFVSRIIGLPGETVDIIHGQVYINGELLEEPYLAEPMDLHETPMHFEVPVDAYFMMGDNRNYAYDSRYWKNIFVYKDKFIAKLGLKYWPFPIEKVE